MAQNTKFSVTKLNGLEDYSSWKFAMKMLLVREKCFKYTSTLPDLKDSVQVDKDEEAMTIICLHLEPHLYPYVQNLTHAKEAWNALATVFEDKGVNRRISLMNCLLDEKLEKHSSMHEYVSAVMSHAQKLKEINHSFDDDLVAVVLLRGLPDVYRPLRMALEHSGMKLTSENVRQKLIQEDSCQSTSNDSSSNTALVARKQSQQSVPKFKCFKCGKKGHKKSECPKLIKQSDEGGYSTVSSKSKKVCLCSSLSVNESFSPLTWYIDSGASNHLSFQKHWFRDIKVTDKNVVTCANNDKVASEGIGDIMVSLKGVALPIKNVSYVPGLRVNLLSVSKLVENGWKIVFGSNGCRMFHQSVGHTMSKLVVTASEVSGIYKLDDCFSVVEGALATVQVSNSLLLWHRRLGHINLNSLCKLSNIDLGGESVMEPCVACIKGKAHRLPFPVGEAGRAKERLSLLHADLCGPMSERSYGGAHYMFVIIDDYTRKIFVYFLKEKSETFDYFKDFVAHVENETSLTVKCLRTDNGKEFVNEKFNKFLSSKGIKHQLTVPYTPEQNGVAERANRTIAEMARTMLLDKGLNKKFWAEACNTAVYVKNRLPHSANDGKIPEEMWTGKVQSYGHLRIFGSTAYVHIPKEKRRKWDAKAKQYLFVGYCENTKGYRFADLSNPRCIVTARDVIFTEDSDSMNSESVKVKMTSPIQNVGENRNAVVWEMDNSSKADTSQLVTEDTRGSNSYVDATESAEFNPAVVGQSVIENTGENAGDGFVLQDKAESRYPLRNRLRDAESGLFCFNIEEEPRSVKEALSRADKDEWEAAMKNELDSMHEHKVWILVDRPEGAKIVGNKWIFKFKYDADGKKSYKARLVAKGFTQSYGEDYFETFSPVVRRSTLRLLLALAAENNLKVGHFDVNTAFLNGELCEKVFMQQPEGCVEKGSKHKVCLLQKAIYGLKQASRSWNEKVNVVLLEMSFNRCEFDNCLYYKEDMFICLYVDDFICFYKYSHQKDKLLQSLRKYFKIKDLGEARQCLGMSIARSTEGTIFLNQNKFIKNLLKEYLMVQCKPVKTPLELDIHKVLAEGWEGEPNHQTQLQYQSLVGALNYLACNTRPDISSAVSFLAQYSSRCNSVHLKAAKRVLRYLKGTCNLGLVFQKSKHKSNRFQLTGHVDADWAGDVRDRKSYSGYIFKIGDNLISWQCKKQSCVALSSTEAEYVALTEACKEGIHLQRLSEFVHRSQGPSYFKLFTDNQSAMRLSYNPVTHCRTKHIDIKYHFVRSCVANNSIQLEYVASEDNLADVMTKPIASPKFVKCVKGLGLELGASGVEDG